MSRHEPRPNLVNADHLDNGQAASQPQPHGRTCHHGPLERHEAEADAICLDHVGYRYGDVEALRDVTLHVGAGCKLGIIGPNGGGKTTLVKLMLGLLDGYTGSIRIQGLSPREVCRRGHVVGYLPQIHQFERRFPVDVRQVVEMGLCGKCGWFGRPSRDDRQRIDFLLEQVGLADLARRPIAELSGGQQQRAFIARALAAGPSILVLDEPTVGIDLAGQKRFADLIDSLHQRLGLTVVVVSHDLRAVASSCEQVACLARTMHFHGSAEGLTPEVLHEVYSHDIAPIFDITTSPRAATDETAETDA